MAEKTLCPACNAPLAISSGDQQVRCDFCGAEYALQQEGGDVRLKLIEQPQPQTDVLAQAGQQAAMEAGKDAADEVAGVLSESTSDTPTPSEDAPPVSSEPTVMYSRQEQPVDFFDQTGASSEPTVFRPSPYTPAETPVEAPVESSVQPDFTPEPTPEPIPEPTPFRPSPEPAAPVAEGVLYDRQGPVPPAGAPQAGKRNTWLPWVIGAVVVLCLTCVCITAAVVMFLMPVMQQY